MRAFKQEAKNLSVTQSGLLSTKFTLVITKAEWLRKKVLCGVSVCVCVCDLRVPLSELPGPPALCLSVHYLSRPSVQHQLQL